MNVIGYCRTSTEEQTQSLTDQRDLLKDWAKEEGHRLEEVYTEQVSGKRSILSRWSPKGTGRDRVSLDLSGRGELREAYENCRRDPGIEAVVIKNPTRLARSHHYIGLLEEAFELVNSPVVYVEDQGSWLESMMKTVLADYEVRQTRKRTKDTLAKKKERDEWVGRPPTGLKVGEDGKLEPDGDRFYALIEARDLVKEDGKGYGSAAQIASVDYETDISRQQVRSFVKKDWGKYRDYLTETAGDHLL